MPSRHPVENRLKGAMTALVTPFDGDRIDEARFREQVAYQVENGIDGLVPVGTTGESPTLSFEEHKRVIELAVAAADGRVPVVAGAGANNTREAAELHAHARSVGADAVLSVNPYYNKPTQEGLYRHFATLSDEVDVPIVLYNIPGRTGVTMSPQTVARLRNNANVVAVKEATGDVGFASQVMAECDVPVLSGDDPLTLPLMSVGAVGVISVLANLLPARVAEMCRLAASGDFASARRIHFDVLGLTRALFLDGNPAGVKYAMKRLGRDAGGVRLPLVEVSPATADAVDAGLRSVGLLD